MLWSLALVQFAASIHYAFESGRRDSTARSDACLVQAAIYNVAGTIALAAAIIGGR